MLTKSNDEAMQVAGLLVKHGMQAKLIQSNDGFSLYNLLEVRYFLSQLHLDQGIYMISDEAWAAAERNLAEKFYSSSNLELCMNLIRDFEAANPRNKYVSDLDLFIRESSLEDFFRANTETILVSTIHKAKGREFDHVFLMLDQFNVGTEEALRQLYVAMTRAKRNLTIHYNGRYLDFIRTDHLQTVDEDQACLPPAQLAVQLTYRDVWLDFFLSCQPLISQLNSGDVLTVDGDCCRNAKGQAVVRFSKQLLNKIEALKKKRYEPTLAKIRYIVFWQKENVDYEVRVVLPELYFEQVEDRRY
ncbi:3'-5' exonuclease [Paenibacillus sp. HJGM_3]|uniref:3'-5' exonuclease n=1 Tax=Paenibacillus sp. HJGM_3 TaxID=3379816 RepID=UPI00385F043B